MKKFNQKGPIAWMAGNSVAANLLMIILIAGGLVCALRIQQEVFPDIAIDSVTVSVAYPGASPAEVEKGIITVIEERLNGLDGVKQVTAKANEGYGSVTVELLPGEDLQKLSQDIKSEVDRITTFPVEAEDPEVMVPSTRRQVISLILYGDSSEKVLKALSEQIRDELLNLDDVTQVEISGVRNREISVSISQENLRAYDLTLNEVAKKIRSSAVEIPGGGIKTTSGEILLRVKERRDYGREFEDLPILSFGDGTHLLLGDIAEVKDEFEDVDKFSSFNGKRAVMLDVYRIGKQTPIEVSKAVNQYITENYQNLPPGIEMTTWNDRSTIYRQRMELLVKNGLFGLALVFILLGIFLEARLAFWVTLGIPISFMGAFLFIPTMDVTLNMVSMFAFIISLGIVVDDAIVVGENVYDYHQRGLGFLEAAIKGAREVAMPVIFSILTNIAAFLPLYFIPGRIGKIFKFIPVVVITVFAISLIESIFILPAHLGHQKDRKRGKIVNWFHTRQQKFSFWFSGLIKNYYGPFLDKALNHRYLTISIGLAILVVTIGYIKSGRMGLTMFPKVESDYAVVTASLAYGAPVEKTIELQNRFIDSADKVIAANGGTNLSLGIFSEIGGSVNNTSGGHVCKIRVLLTPMGQRPISTEKFVKAWREAFGQVVGLEYLSFQSDSGGPGSGSSMNIELSHRNVDTLEKASADLAAAIAAFPSAKDIDDGVATGKKQYDFKLTPAGQSLGIDASALAVKIRSSFYGAEALRQQRQRDEVKVKVRLPKSERNSLYDLEELLIKTPAGGEIPLRDAVQITTGHAYTILNRRDGKRVISVQADIDPRSSTGQIVAALKKDTLPLLQNKYPGLGYSLEGSQADLKESMNSLFVGFGMAMFIVYALLAIPLKSYSLPLIIMISIPFGIVGAAIGHIVMGYSLSIMSMMGIVALSGVVVNDSLVLMEYANRQNLDQGLTPFAAVHAAGIRRFRPIMLTTLTTFGGLAPMIFETSRQARFLIPMAISLGFGILFATFISLLLVPCFYVMTMDIKRALDIE